MRKQIRKKSPSIYYKTEMIKKGKNILWRAVEMPSKLVLKESFFEEDIKPIVKFQNKNSIWEFEKIYFKEPGNVIEEAFDKDFNVIAKYLGFSSYTGDPNTIVNIENKEEKEYIINILENQLKIISTSDDRIFCWQIEKNKKKLLLTKRINKLRSY